MTAADWHVQDDYDIRFEWGAGGTKALSPRSSVVVIIDVLRFTTAVCAAVSVGVAVYPYQQRDESATKFARSVHAQLADESDPSGPTLSPFGYDHMAPRSKAVLPSPNGSTCACLASDAGATVVAGCLRNAAAVARWCNGTTPPFTVIACGERWTDGWLRPSLEDLLGAGAVISGLLGTRSPEAELAATIWAASRDDFVRLVSSCGSAIELFAKGHEGDVAYASELNVSAVVPVLRDHRFLDASA